MHIRLNWKNVIFYALWPEKFWSGVLRYGLCWVYLKRAGRCERVGGFDWCFCVVCHVISAILCSSNEWQQTATRNVYPGTLHTWNPGNVVVYSQNLFVDGFTVAIYSGLWVIPVFLVAIVPSFRRGLSEWIYIFFKTCFNCTAFSQNFPSGNIGPWLASTSQRQLCHLLLSE